MKHKITVLGITGSLGSGKTSVAKIFQSLGATSINADEIYHLLIRPGTVLYRKVVSVFGKEILKKNRRIDRQKLGQLVFNKRPLLTRLCQITHPPIIRNIKAEIARIKKNMQHQLIVIDAPLLIEAGLTKIVDRLLVVKINRKSQMARCRRLRGLSDQAILERIRAQIPLAKKIKLADYVIDNNGTLEKTREQVQNIWQKLN